MCLKLLGVVLKKLVGIIAGLITLVNVTSKGETRETAGNRLCSSYTDGVREIAFADITDYVEFGQKEEDVLGLEGDPAFDPDTGETKKYRYQHWTGHFNPAPTMNATWITFGYNL
ncbi:hypothetical protein ACN92M_26570 (plasmid) [Paenibacillus polymyxa]|uniref:hypothetical protein n=1 Tax=Paenibacillus polymyxa TaxID=1406 RepID=UPI003B5A9BB6